MYCFLEWQIPDVAQFPSSGAVLKALYLLMLVFFCVLELVSSSQQLDLHVPLLFFPCMVSAYRLLQLTSSFPGKNSQFCTAVNEHRQAAESWAGATELLLVVVFTSANTVDLANLC